MISALREAQKRSKERDLQALALLPSELSSNRVAIVATGSWGREEVSPYSDLDLLIIAERDSHDSKWIETWIRALWDSGLSVGHAVRTLRETEKLLEKDIRSLTTLLDSRLLVGSAALHKKLARLTRGQLKATGATSFVQEKWEERGRRFTETWNRHSPTRTRCEVWSGRLSRLSIFAMDGASQIHEGSLGYAIHSHRQKVCSKTAPNGGLDVLCSRKAA